MAGFIVSLSRGAAVVLLVAAGLAGCAGASTAPVTEPAASVAPTPTPPPTAQPIEQVVPLDPAAEKLVADSQALLAATDGWASAEARDQLDAAAQQLAADIQVVQLSMAGGPAASQASPPVDEQTIADDITAVLDAVGAVRTGVVATSIQVVNEGAPDAEQALRDTAYLAIVAQQAASAAPATVETPAQLLDLVAKTRATQDSQLAYNEEQARLAAEAAAAAQSNDAQEPRPPLQLFTPKPFEPATPVCVVVDGFWQCDVG